MTTLMEIVEIVRRDTNIREIDCQRIIRSCFDIIKEILETGDSVQIADFGLFSIKTRKERTLNSFGVNEIVVPAHGVVSFRPYSELKQLVWGIVDDEED